MINQFYLILSMNVMHHVYYNIEYFWPKQKDIFFCNESIIRKENLTCKMSAWFVCVFDNVRNSFVVIKHRSRFSGETKSSAIFIHECKFLTYNEKFIVIIQRFSH